MRTNNTFTNPVLRGDYPDPTIIRVGSDYYMTHTSMHYTPGLLIWHSRNLVSWEPVAYALNQYDGDVWAPELVHRNGIFYIYYPTEGKNHVITAKNINGPWSRPVDLKVGHIDPGHVAGKDGKRYLHLSGGHFVEIADDGLSVRGEVRKVYDGWAFPDEWRTEGFCLESPKIIFKDGYYHMLVAQGGTAGPACSHMVAHARSENPWGPWENSPYNPIIRTTDSKQKWWSRGHGSLIDTPEGDWWIVYHAYENGFRTLGRQVLLEPVEWTNDGWLKTAADPEKPIRRPSGSSVCKEMNLSDDFSVGKIGMQWRFWGQPDISRFNLKEGCLEIKGTGKSPSDSTPMVCITGDHSYEIGTVLEIEGDVEAGLVLFYNPSCYVSISAGKEGIRLGAQGKLLHWTRQIRQGKRITLKIVNDKNEIEFWYRVNGDGLKKIPESFDVSGYNHNNFGGFLGLRPGIFCAGDGKARFYCFQYGKM